jgi:hypothetical protein
LWWVSGESPLQTFDPILGEKFEHLVYVKFVCEMHIQLWCFVGNFAPSHLLYHKPSCFFCCRAQSKSASQVRGGPGRILSSRWSLT